MTHHPHVQHLLQKYDKSGIDDVWITCPLKKGMALVNQSLDSGRNADLTSHRVVRDHMLDTSNLFPQARNEIADTVPEVKMHDDPDQIRQQRKQILPSPLQPRHLIVIKLLQRIHLHP